MTTNHSKKTGDQLRRKKSERNALAWLTRQGAWELRFDQLHRMNMGAEPGRRRVSDNPAA
jgi:hypothetical protein